MTVKLMNSLGDDLRIVNAARVSFAKESDWIKHFESKHPSWLSWLPWFRTQVLGLSDKDKGLINYLMKHRHGTPFETVIFDFHVKAPIFVAREWMRHRIASYNEVSGRYVELEEKFYIPPIEAVRKQVGKPGNYIYEPMSPAEAEFAIGIINKTYQFTWAMYQTLLEHGVAKELARVVLPVGIYTEFYWTINLRSLLNFLELRNAPNALLEIRQEAQEIERIVSDIVPITMTAFERCGRRAP